MKKMKLDLLFYFLNKFPYSENNLILSIETFILNVA
jgi:hypothetical protein